MTPEQPDQPGPDPNRTIRHRWPQPEPPRQEPGQSPYTQRLPYTPDMLPDVPQYEAKPPKSGCWWVIVVGGVAVLVVAVAVVALLWARSTVEPPVKPGSQSSVKSGPARITDTKAQVSYLIPEGWAKADRPSYTSGIAAGGAVVVAFPQQQGGIGGAATSEQLQARADAVALDTARRFLPDLGSRDGLRTQALEVGGQPAATASFRVVFKSATKDPAYVRIVAVHTADGGLSYVYGSTVPDGDAARQALDGVLDSVTPA
ncbi:hypothetical protein [Nonomuraea sp. NPDC048901]|uniref:hypothetical protein n=1 Tax=Nonomuraea sp. NPDC048901 TaxID=3155627 RepID=UPI0033FD9083